MSFKQEYKKVWKGEEVKLISKQVMGKSAFETGLIVEGYAKTLCPIDTGRLAASITTQSQTGSTFPKGRGAVSTDLIEPPRSFYETYVGTPVEYAPYNEYGTVKLAPQPFLRPALAMAKGETLTVFLANGRAQFKEFLRVV